MKLLLILAVVAFVGCGKKEEASKESDPPKAAPEKLIANPIVEKAIRKSLKGMTSDITEADLEKVAKLDLRFAKITDAGLKDVAKLQQLTYLRLSNTKITDAGLKELAKLQKLTQLQLTQTKITDAGLKEVAKMQQLESLGLMVTQVTKAGVAELKKALPKCAITHNAK